MKEMSVEQQKSVPAIVAEMQSAALSTRQDAASPKGERLYPVAPGKGLKTALGARGASDPTLCRPKPRDAFCKGLEANCKAHPDKGAD